ncbi:hypothetical protein OVA07_14930 [Novosphingobium sp. SL115]|uniref:hypothetical protein n=1 Tax=Novosphingobium sp. SL115 TaxID=2995150 RepID=UPI0022741808|nr:hypothetical protein [Novosphingobium sp. SL115]MCY1672299.1 hypothetical protein [Novosphingobium sp. SL115]
MSFWSAVVAIVAIIAFARIRMNRDSARHIHHDQPPVDQAYTASLEREVAEMRKRLEVLERIATDDGETRRLSREIESLRDQ